MREEHSDYRQSEERAAEASILDTLQAPRRGLPGWIRRAFGAARDRSGLLTMTPDGKVVPVERAEKA